MNAVSMIAAAAAQPAAINRRVAFDPGGVTRR
jgi:hypothetical protein